MVCVCSPQITSSRESVVLVDLSGIVTKKRLTLAVSADHSTALEWIPAEHAWYSKSNGGEEQYSHDGESLDPLDGNDGSQELTNAES